MDSQSTEDRLTWRAIRKDLEHIGISVTAFEANRDFVLGWLSHAVETGAFEEKHSADSEKNSIPNSPSDFNCSIAEEGLDAPGINASMEVYRGTDCYNSIANSDQTLPCRSRSESLPGFTQSLPLIECGSSSQLKVPSPTLPTSLEHSISCERCGKFNIAYELHMHCEICNDGNYDLCLQCWRHGRGCLNWYGFGQSAMAFWNSTVRSKAIESSNCAIPHILTGRQYRRVAIRAPPAGPEDGAALIKTSTDSNVELQSGFFCSNCSAFAHDDFWVCDICNDGEWGYCVVCVRHGRCCTHPLLHVGAHPSTNISSSSPVDPQPSGKTPQFSPLACSINCSICDLPIPPSGNHFHCPQCDDGDYDMCIDCYLRLVNNGQISEEDGPRGWRRCLKGHRMIIFGFGFSARGQRFVVIKDLVGGHALNVSEMSHTSGEYPPSGGGGLRVSAQWSYWPKDGDDDELAFPRGAEIKECENVDGNWSWGVYCGRTGLFPSSYCRGVVERVSDYPERCHDAVDLNAVSATKGQ